MLVYYFMWLTSKSGAKVEIHDAADPDSVVVACSRYRQVETEMKQFSFKQFLAVVALFFVSLGVLCIKVSLKR